MKIENKKQIEKIIELILALRTTENWEISKELSDIKYFFHKGRVMAMSEIIKIIEGFVYKEENND